MLIKDGNRKQIQINDEIKMKISQVNEQRKNLETENGKEIQ